MSMLGEPGPFSATDFAMKAFETKHPTPNQLGSTRRTIAVLRRKGRLVRVRRESEWSGHGSHCLYAAVTDHSNPF